MSDNNKGFCWFDIELLRYFFTHWFKRLPRFWTELVILSKINCFVNLRQTIWQRFSYWSATFLLFFVGRCIRFTILTIYNFSFVEKCSLTTLCNFTRWSKAKTLQMANEFFKIIFVFIKFFNLTLKKGNFIEQLLVAWRSEEHT